MGSDKREWSGKSRGGAWGHYFFVLLIRRIGIRAAYIFLSLIVIYFVPFAPKATRAIWSYNRKILKYGRFKSLIKLYCHYFVFGQTLIDKIAISSGLRNRYEFIFENYEEFLRQLDSGAATIIGAHVGCWEIGASYFGEYGSKMNVVMYDAEYQKIKEVVNQARAPYKIIAINDGDISSIVRMKQAIDNSEYLCFQGDRYLSEANTEMVNFMEAEARFPTGPTLLASKFRTPTIFYFAMRESGRKYRFIFNIAPSGLSQKELMKQYITTLEGIVRKYPQQWFNFYDVW